MKTTKEITEQQKTALAFLRKTLKPGSKVYTIVRGVSSSGMSRKISAFIIKKGEIINIDWYVSHVLDYRRDMSNGALKVGGCGMDMCFHIVYSLGRKLYPKGFKLPKGKHGRNGDTSGYDNDGGYSLVQMAL